MNTNIDCFKPITVVALLYNKNMDIRIKKFSFRDYALQCFIMSLLAMNGFYLIIFNQMISISDCLCKLVYTGSGKMLWHTCRLNKRQIKKETKECFCFPKSTYDAIFLYNAILLCFSITLLFFVSFAAMNWTFFVFAAINNEHRTFIVETFTKTNKSVTATQRTFRLHFDLGRRDPVPSRNTILFWVTNFKAIETALKRKRPTLHRQNPRK